MLPKDAITAIILAGGNSSRMGQDKALIQVEGIPLLRKIALLACECAESVYVITPWIERYSSILPNQCHLIRESVETRHDKSLPHGPLVAFAQGLTHVHTEWVLLLACDLPCLTVDEVKLWRKYLDTVAEDACVLLPRLNNLWQPLSGFYRRRCLEPAINDFINQGGQSFQGWLADYPVQELSISSPQVLFNCNSPEDLSLILETMGYNHHQNHYSF